MSRKSLHYRHLAESLERSDLSRFTPVFVSHDSADDTMLDITKALKQRFPRLEHKLHPHRCELVELNASQFPRYSTDGVEQPHWRYTCAKHHWLWAFSQAWKIVPQSIEHMLYLEEDFAVAKHVGQLLRQLIAAADSSPHHLGTMLQVMTELCLFVPPGSTGLQYLGELRQLYFSPIGCGHLFHVFRCSAGTTCGLSLEH